MKRSKLLEILAESIEHLCHPDMVDRNLHYRVAERMLIESEKVGMLPPFCERLHDEFELGHDLTNYHELDKE